MSIKYFTGLQCFIFLLRFFLLAGLATVSVRVNQTSKVKPRGIQLNFAVSRLAILYNILLICLVLGVCYAGITTASTVIYGGKISMFQIVDFSQVTFCCLSAGLILYSYCLRSWDLASILKRSYDLHLVLAEYNQVHHYHAIFKYVVLCFVLNFLIVLIFLVTGILYFRNVILFLACFVPNTVVFWLVVQYAIVVRVLLSMFRIANEAIKQISACYTGKIGFNEAMRCVNLVELKQKLAELHRIYSAMCRISQEVSSFYGVPILCSVIYIFICLVVYMYCLLNLAIDEYQPFLLAEYVHLATWNICFMLSIIILTRNVSSVINEVQQTHNIVAELTRGNVSGDLKAELKDFSWYFINKRMTFTACEFFTLDNTLVASIINSMATYLVILVQFQMQIVVYSTANGDRNLTCQNCTKITPSQIIND